MWQPVRKLCGSVVVAAAVWVSALAAPAEAVDTRLIFAQDGWQLHHEVFAHSGAEVCTVSRINDHGDRLDIALFSNGRIELYLFMSSNFDSWFGTFRGPALLSVDDSPWVFHNAEYEPYAISVGFPDRDQALDFFQQLHDGDELILLTPRGEAIVADWSLYGLAPAFARTVACRNEIRAAHR